MFWICVTVAITWSLKAISEIFLLFFAILKYRRFGPKPKPESSCCWNEKRYIAPKAGDRLKKALFVVWRLLLNSKETLDPVAKAWANPKIARPELSCSSGTP